jgi:hypothetical protein
VLYFSVFVVHAVVRLNTVVTIEPEAIRSENATTVGRVLLSPVLGCLFHEAAQRLNGDIALISGVIFLRGMRRLTSVRRQM